MINSTTSRLVVGANQLPRVLGRPLKRRAVRQYLFGKFSLGAELHILFKQNDKNLFLFKVDGLANIFSLFLLTLALITSMPEFIT